MKPERTIATRISYIARLFRKRFDYRAQLLGLTRAQWQTIAVVRWHEGCTQRELAELLEVGSVTAGRLVERLEQAGWLERSADPADRRAYRLYINAKAQPALERLSALSADEERRALEGVNDEHRAIFVHVLDHIIGNLGERGDCRSESIARPLSEVAG